MDYQAFKTEITDKVQAELSDSVRISLEQIPKNNGMIQDGFVFTKEGANASPIIYIEEYYQLWKKGVPMEQLVQKLLWNYTHCCIPNMIKEDFFLDYQTIKNHIYFKLVNYERNKTLLAQVPHRRILDLAVVYYYQMDHAMILIRNSHLELWKIPEEILEKNAEKYAVKNLPAEILTIGKLAEAEGEDGELPDEEEFPDVPMYVLTNMERCLGAAAILYPGVLKNMSYILGDRFYILPSSIHECILIPQNGRYTQDELSAMVAEINEKHVERKDILSDHVYFYLEADDRIHL